MSNQQELAHVDRTGVEPVTSGTNAEVLTANPAHTPHGLLKTNKKPLPKNLAEVF